MGAPTASTGRKRENENWTLRGEKFGAATFLIVAAGLFPFYQLFNPADSGKILFVDRCNLARNVTPSFVYCFGLSVVGIPALTPGFSYDGGGPGVGLFDVLSGLFLPFTSPPSTGVIRVNLGTNTNREISFADAPVILREGTGLAMTMGSVGAVALGGFDWREVDPTEYNR